MNWKIITTSEGWSDVERLSSSERLAISEDLMAWIADGPPRQSHRTIAGVTLFEDDLPSGFRVTYIAHEPDHYVAVVRVRKL